MMFRWGGFAGGGGECTHGGNASVCATMVPLARERTADDGGGESATGVDASAAPLFHVHSQPSAEQAAPVATLHTLSLECRNGWTLLGELSKFATHSTSRFRRGASAPGFCAGEGLSVSCAGYSVLTTPFNLVRRVARSTLQLTMPYGVRTVPDGCGRKRWRVGVCDSAEPGARGGGEDGALRWRAEPACSAALPLSPPAPQTIGATIVLVFEYYNIVLYETDTDA
eukprot:SAG25_NODE_851_length_5076_cov_2.739401_6_plen_226_part_00